MQVQYSTQADAAVRDAALAPRAFDLLLICAARCRCFFICFRLILFSEDLQRFVSRQVRNLVLSFLSLER